MRHRKGGRKLNMNPSHRKATFRNMVTSLVLHGSIKTTVARAKELSRFAEKVITIAKQAPSAAAIDGMSGDEAATAKATRVHAIRRARRWINDDVALQKLFAEYSARFEDRSGGYTRVVKAGVRQGDNAPMAVIEFLGESQSIEPFDGAGEE